MHTHIHIETHTWLPSSTSGKEPARQCRRLWRCRLVSWISRKTPPGEGHGIPLQYSGLENPMGRGAWWATVHGVAESRTQLKQLSTAHTHTYPTQKNTCQERGPRLNFKKWESGSSLITHHAVCRRTKTISKTLSFPTINLCSL